MFTGIIETTGKIERVEEKGNNRSFWVTSRISHGLEVDQSVSHDGVCLTIENIQNGCHQVTAIRETLHKTTLNVLQPGHILNLEQCMKWKDRLDGHIVQGHVDGKARCTAIADKQGSWEYQFEFDAQFAELIIEKGSICLNGISLTTFNITKNSFWVGIVPYTFNHTNIQFLQKDDLVNIEFDVVGKYINRKMSLHH